MSWKKDERDDRLRYDFVDSRIGKDFSVYIREDNVVIDENFHTSAHFVILRKDDDQGSSRTVVGVDTNPYEAEEILKDFIEKYRDPQALNKMWATL